MKAFKSFQIVLCFALAPWLIGLIPDGYHTAVTWVAWIGYTIGFCVMCGAMYTAIEEWEK